MNDSITITQNGGIICSGPKAVNAYAIKATSAAIKLYAKCGIIPTRGMTISKMLKAAAHHTGKKSYKRTQAGYAEAAADLDALFVERATALMTA